MFVYKIIKIKEDKVMKELDFLKKLVSIKSFDLNKNEEIIEYLKGEFEGIASEIMTLKNTVNERENLLVGLNCKLNNVSNCIVLSGHVDTVFPSDIKLNPYGFDPTIPGIVDGKLYGLGAIDMKSFWAVVLNNFEKLKQLSTPIVLAITGDEETSIQGAGRVVEKLKELNINPSAVIVGEPTGSQICSASKGYWEYKVEIMGKSCHSSVPFNGVNANYVMAKLMLKIEELCNKYPNTTCTCNVVSGGKSVNAISDFATMDFDVRSSVKAYADSVMDEINKKIKELLEEYKGVKINMKNTYAVPPLEKKNPKFIDDICNEFNKTEVEFTGACEGGYFQELCDKVFIYGVGDLKLCHQPNEHANITEFLDYNQSFVDFVNNVSKL